MSGPRKPKDLENYTIIPQTREALYRQLGLVDSRLDILAELGLADREVPSDMCRKGCPLCSGEPVVQAASYVEAGGVATGRQQDASRQREKERSDWRNGQLRYPVAALAFKSETAPERRPVLAWVKEAR